MLARKVQDSLEQALDYTERLERVILDATDGLALPGEMTQGLKAQRLQLSDLVGSFNAKFRHTDDPGAVDAWLFTKISDVWSLNPQNQAFLPLCGHLTELLSGDAAERLRRDVQDQVCILHISCRARIERAEQSIDSFKAYAGDLQHLKVVGNKKVRSGGFLFTYNGSLLTLSSPDDYSGHCIKCLHTHAVLGLVGAPRLVYKIDDDVRLEAPERFTNHIKELLVNDVDFAGHPVTGIHNHRNFWHGWHLGKNLNTRLEVIGCQSPIGKRYADGGFGYALGKRSLQELVYCFFTHQAFLAIDSIQFEDVSVGLFLEMAGVELTPVTWFSTGLSSDRQRMQIDLEACWDEYMNRKLRGLEGLRDHPIFACQAGRHVGLQLPVNEEML